ncbi:MAG: hypothetical protein AAB456_01960 [Patescibacteria group bacterium]
MKKKYLKIIVSSVLISSVGVLIIDYLSHLFFSNPMETLPYFMAKMALYFVFSIIFLSIFDLNEKELVKVSAAGIIVSSMWGVYYNILPPIFGYYTFGLALRGLTFLGMGLFGTGFAFGTVHAVAFIGGYYASKRILKNF